MVDGVWSDGDAGGKPLTPLWLVGYASGQCYSHLCLWPSFYITNVYQKMKFNEKSLELISDPTFST